MRFLVLLVALALLILAAGCTTQVPPAAQSTQTPVITAAPVATTVLTTLPTTLPTTVSTTLPTTLPTTRVPKLDVETHGFELYVPDNSYSAPRSGYMYLLADFSITNVGVPNGYSYNPNYVTIEDSDGYRYSYASASYSVPGVFKSVTIPQGKTLRGKLLFEVPKLPSGATKYQLWVKGV